MTDKLQIAFRYLLLSGCFFLPAQRKKQLERWLRGREEFMRLQRADWILMSWGKSGRTWLRVMLSRFYQLNYGLDQHQLLDFDNLKRSNPAAPAVFFSHNNYLRDYTGNWESKSHFLGKKIVLLVRDPRDVAVSQFFQWQYRMRPRKKFINDYPTHGADISAWDFVLDEKAGVPRIVDYFNGWAQAMPELGDILIVRYEDMRANPEQVLSRILQFTDTPGTTDQINEAVAFAAYDNMKKMEEKRFFRTSGARVRPGDKNNPDSFKVRKAKVGGFRDYFTEPQCQQLEQLIAKLDPLFGYGGA